MLVMLPVMALPVLAQHAGGEVVFRGIVVTASGGFGGVELGGIRFTPVQAVLVVMLTVAGMASWFLIQHVFLRTCDCYCGPGKCECTCACNKSCPCFYRDKSAHNDEFRHSNFT